MSIEDKIKWLKAYSEEKKETFFDVTDERLCDAWNDATGLEKKALGAFLSKAYKRGCLTRARIGISSGYWHNPNWVYSYQFTEKHNQQ